MARKATPASNRKDPSASPVREKSLHQPLTDAGWIGPGAKLRKRKQPNLSEADKRRLITLRNAAERILFREPDLFSKHEQSVITKIRSTGSGSVYQVRVPTFSEFSLLARAVTRIRARHAGFFTEFELKAIPLEIQVLRTPDGQGYYTIIDPTADVQLDGGKKSRQDAEVKSTNALASIIEKSYRESLHVKAAVENTALSPPELDRLIRVFSNEAAKAVRVAGSDAPQQSDQIVDPVSGLVLPPPLRKPYQQRGKNGAGKRLTIVEHLQQEYPDYLKHKLLFSGHLQEIDLPAYKALLRQGAKEALERGEPTQGSASSFFAKHGLLTSEHLASPAKDIERQVRLIKQLHQARIASGMYRRLADEIDDLSRTND